VTLSTDYVRGRRNPARSATALLRANRLPVLHFIVDTSRDMLGTADGWCSDRPDCTLSWPCRISLHRFYGLSGDAMSKTEAFAPIKQPRSLRSCPNLALRFLVSLHRVMQPHCHHFDVEHDTQPRPQGVIIRLTKGHQRAWDLVVQMAILRRKDHGSASSHDDEWDDVPIVTKEHSLSKISC